MPVSASSAATLTLSTFFVDTFDVSQSTQSAFFWPTFDNFHVKPTHYSAEKFLLMQDWIRQVLHLPSKEHALLLLRPLIKPFSYFIEHSYRSVDLEAVAGSIETSQELQFINL